ncbi:hypothetical protein RvY_10697 [Ramazzottius varieornatus]|uniref:Uncharacterized protein n=1 Tax=Ramazzottius varieornatus TaxID=947166 RepID=A0A1D1VDK8_RAMVA|nr:hypothetical protein RvY_10697 [Ramazzottius varieornatus]
MHTDANVNSDIKAAGLQAQSAQCLDPPGLPEWAVYSFGSSPDDGFIALSL